MKKNVYRKFDLMMSVIELLKQKTGFIFRINIQEQNGKCVFLINKSDLNKRKTLELSRIVDVSNNANTIDVTNYYLENTFGTTNINLIDNKEFVLINHLVKQVL